ARRIRSARSSPQPRVHPSSRKLRAAAAPTAPQIPHRLASTIAPVPLPALAASAAHPRQTRDTSSGIDRTNRAAPPSNVRVSAQTFPPAPRALRLRRRDLPMLHLPVPLSAAAPAIPAPRERVPA